MAASLPRGVSPPVENASWLTPEDDAVWVLVKSGRAYVYRTSGHAFFAAVVSTLRVPAPTRMTVEFLRAFRNAMLVAAQDVSQVSDARMTKETLRAMAWWISENEGRREGTPGTRIWLPNGRVVAPDVGEAIPNGPDGVRSSELRASSSQGGGPVIFDGGSSGGGSSGGSSGGGSSGGHSGGSGSSSGGRSSSSSSSSSAIAEAAMTGGKVLLVGAVLVGLGVAAVRVSQGRNPLDRPAFPPLPSRGAPRPDPALPSKSGLPRPDAPPARTPRDKTPPRASSKVLAALKGGA